MSPQLRVPAGRRRALVSTDGVRQPRLHLRQARARQSMSVSAEVWRRAHLHLSYQTGDCRAVREGIPSARHIQVSRTPAGQPNLLVIILRSFHGENTYLVRVPRNTRLLAGSRCPLAFSAANISPPLRGSFCTRPPLSPHPASYC